jgi:hypothetical protein
MINKEEFEKRTVEKKHFSDTEEHLKYRVEVIEYFLSVHKPSTQYGLSICHEITKSSKDLDSNSSIQNARHSPLSSASS